MTNVYIDKNSIDGIRRVVEAQYSHLPKFGINLVSSPEGADVICNHGATNFSFSKIPSVHIGHGLMWSRYPWGTDFQDVNAKVVESMAHAVAHTAPSEWVSRAIRRGGYWYPEVVYHGVDADKFGPQENGGYVLWNKARADWVSNPVDPQTLARFMPKTPFRSTIGTNTANFKVIGVQKHEQMKQTVAQAAVYLSTARETFGIGTLEALACGVPVAGWDWGGNSEIVVHGQTGYLAPPGDYNALRECVQLCYAERDRLSANALADIRSRWGWEKRIEQYANIFKRVNEKYNGKGPKVSVIVTAYKLDKYLPACLDSIARQTFTDFECVVIDDASLESTKEIVRGYAKRDKRFSYVATPNNFGLVGSRNFGVSRSRGEYIRHVDADDFLADNALGLEVAALDRDRGAHIVYGHLEVVREDGSRVLQNGTPVRGGWPEEQFKWTYQMAHLNQLPSCSMARKDVYEKSGGYRERMKRQEDAEFWCRVTSLGFRAKKFTQAVTYFHRERADSKGASEWQDEGREPDWTAWFPWRIGGTDFQSGWDKLRKTGERHPAPLTVPFGAQGQAPDPLKFWYVHDYAYPTVSIVVTVGPGHKRYLLDALDSIQAQTYPDWECVVVNDTGEKWEPDIMGAPWARVVNMDGNQGASQARNAGAKHISPYSRFVVFLDADDYWMPWYLETMVAHGQENDGVIYSDLIMQKGEKDFEILRYKDFQSEKVAGSMQYPGSSVLYPRKVIDAMVAYQGGYDEQIAGMEDWDYQIGVHHLGFCAFHVEEPLFVYRMFSSTKRETDYAKIEKITAYVDRKYPQYRKKKERIMCGCNQTKKPAAKPPVLTSSGEFEQVVTLEGDGHMVTMEYLGSNESTFSIRSRVAPDVRYRFGNNNNHRVKSVFAGDVDFLLAQNERGNPSFRTVAQIMAQDANDPAAFLGQPVQGV